MTLLRKSLKSSRPARQRRDMRFAPHATFCCTCDKKVVRHRRPLLSKKSRLGFEILGMTVLFVSIHFCAVLYLSRTPATPGVLRSCAGRFIIPARCQRRLYVTR
jgi:hypothetical protein